MPSRPVTYDQPVEATLIVRLANGKEWEAKPEDVAKFGYVNRNDAYMSFDDKLTAVLRDGGMLTDDQDLTDAALNPISYLVELAINHPTLLEHPDFVDTADQIVAIEQAVLRDRARAATGQEPSRD